MRWWGFFCFVFFIAVVTILETREKLLYLMISVGVYRGGFVRARSSKSAKLKTPHPNITPPPCHATVPLHTDATLTPSQPLSVPLSAENWGSHLDPNALWMSNKAAFNRQCVRGYWVGWMGNNSLATQPGRGLRLNFIKWSDGRVEEEELTTVTFAFYYFWSVCLRAVIRIQDSESEKGSLDIVRACLATDCS